MDNSFLILSLLTLVLFVLFGITLSSFDQKISSQEVKEPFSNVTSSFTQYENNILGIKMEYPDDWILIINSNSSIIFAPPSFHPLLELRVDPIENKSLDQYIKEDIRRENSTSSLDRPLTMPMQVCLPLCYWPTNLAIISSTAENLDEIIAKKLVFTTEEPLLAWNPDRVLARPPSTKTTSPIDYKHIKIYTPFNDKVYVIHYSAVTDLFEGHEPTALRMIKSFNFLNRIPQN